MKVDANNFLAVKESANRCSGTSLYIREGIESWDCNAIFATTGWQTQCRREKDSYVMTCANVG